MFENRKGKSFGEVVFEILVCALVGSLIAAALVYGAGMEPLI